MQEVKTSGTVVGHESHRSAVGDHFLVHPVVRFETANEETVEFESSVGSNAPPAVGAAIEVVYDPENPQSARVPVAAVSRFGLAPFYVAGGFIAVVVGVMFLVVLVFVAFVLLVALA